MQMPDFRKEEGEFFMKKSCITFLLAGIIILTALIGTSLSAAALSKNATITAEYLRIHIRADSNEAAAQEVKYEIRDEVVETLIPVLSVTRDKAEAKRAIEKNLAAVKAAAEAVLKQRGFSYGASAELTVEHFPSRTYDGVTLPEGDYDSLIVNLGSGKGDNWWCVAYPPLCFSTAGKTNVAYKSLILERIREWKARCGNESDR